MGSLTDAIASRTNWWFLLVMSRTRNKKTIFENLFILSNEKPGWSAVFLLSFCQDYSVSCQPEAAHRVVPHLVSSKGKARLWQAHTAPTIFFCICSPMHFQPHQLLDITTKVAVRHEPAFLKPCSPTTCLNLESLQGLPSTDKAFAPVVPLDAFDVQKRRDLAISAPADTLTVYDSVNRLLHEIGFELATASNSISLPTWTRRPYSVSTLLGPIGIFGVLVRLGTARSGSFCWFLLQAANICSYWSCCCQGYCLFFLACLALVACLSFPTFLPLPLLVFFSLGIGQR